MDGTAPRAAHRGTPRVSHRVSHHVVVHDRREALVVALPADWAADADDAVAAAVERAVLDQPDVELVVLDARALTQPAPLRLGWAGGLLAGREWVWVASPRSLDALEAYVEREQGLTAAEWVFGSLEAAMNALVARRKAGRVVLRDRHGDRVREHEWLARGRVERHFEQGVCRTTDLFHRGQLLERTGLDDGVAWVAQWPGKNALGEESAACRFQARLVFEQGQLIELDFSRDHTGRALRPDWLEVAAQVAGLRTLDLSGQPVGDAAVLAALERLPGLESLALCDTEVTDACVAGLAAARPALRIVR